MKAQKAKAAARTAPTKGNITDLNYVAFLARLRLMFLENIKDGAEPLFTTDAEGLFDAYLSGFLGAKERQHHTCSACRHFVNRFAGLVTIDEAGRTSPILQGLESDELYGDALKRVNKIVRQAKVAGVFLSPEAVLGTPETGEWKHMWVKLPASVLHKRTTLTARQMMAERHEDFINVYRALAEFKQEALDATVQLLKSEALYRSEKVLGPAEWLRDLQEARTSSRHKANTVWRALAVAPAGFCHPRSSMVGTLLEDLGAGLPFEDAAKRFKAKMHPLLYQRPQAPPKAGTIAQAEKTAEQMGIGPSLKRRFARLDEIEALWLPKLYHVEKTPKGGLFGHLKTKAQAQQPSSTRAPPITMTFEKFRRVVLPEAEKIEFYARAHRDSFGCFVTAVDPDAPPILQWDSLGWRNPVSWYVWHGGSSPESMGLTHGGLHGVTAISLQPSMWHEAQSHQGMGVLFALEGARETRRPGAALFPEILKAELRGVRSVIEAYSHSATLEGAEEGSACGLLLQKGQSWEHLFRVTSKNIMADYRLDRWD